MLTGNIPLAVATFVATNPYVAAYVLQAYGLAKNSITGIISKIASKKKLLPNEADDVMKAIKEADDAGVQKAIMESPVLEKSVKK